MGSHRAVLFHCICINMYVIVDGTFHCPIYIYILLTIVIPTGREEVDFSWKPMYVPRYAVCVT